MIALGATDIGKIYKGASEVQKIYLGATEVWSGLDPDAAAYIALVEIALGSSISTVQKNALDVFYRAEKLAGRYTYLKRMYLPIWGNAAANAICMVSRTSGTFVGTVTHGAGFVRGDGSTGYFNTRVTGPAIGMSGGNSMLMSASKLGPSISRECGTFGGPRLARSRTGGGLNLNATAAYSSPSFGLRATTTVSNAPSQGIIIGSATSTSLRVVQFRKGSSNNISSNTTLDTGTFAGSNIFFGAFSNSNTPIQFSDEEAFAWAAGLGMTSLQCAGFTSSVQTLWQTATGLTLP
jgi:hypothetical protein